jgi:hypothetical protein
MTFWNNILHTALLGTDKATVTPGDLGQDLSPFAEQITALTQDKEERFLQIAALAFNYRQAGAMSLQKADAQLTPAPQEERPYCSPAAMLALNDMLQEESASLLAHWLQLCRTHSLLATPDVLHLLLQIGLAHKHLREDILACGGQRARWLAGLNPDWAPYTTSADTEEQLWQTGTPEQRRHILLQLRKTDPGKAREWLQSSWSQEDANTKADLLQTFYTNPSAGDTPFLESLAGEKSKKVKTEALILLKKIPSSDLVRQYTEALTTRLILKKEKSLLGMMSKTTLEIKPGDELPEILIRSGIEKLSNKKEMTDDAFICYQLMSSVPFGFFTTHWQKSPEEIIRLFNDDPLGKQLLPALVLSVVNFADTAHAIQLMQHATVFYLDLLPLLPIQQQEYYSNKFFQSSPASVIQYATQREKEWGPELTNAILRQAAKEPWTYNRVFFNKHIHLIPIAAAGLLDNIKQEDVPPTTAGAWAPVSEAIRKLIHLKTQTIKAFIK